MTSKRLLFLLIAAILAPLATFAQSTIIYQTGFEEYASGSLPTGWTKVISGSSAKALSSNAHTGTNSFGFTYAPKKNGTYYNIVALPAFEIVTGSASIEFWSKAETNNAYCGQFEVGYITDVTNGSTFVPMANYNYTQHLNYTHIALDMSQMPENARIAFRHHPNTTNYKWYIDDLKVYAELFCCPQPSVATPTTTPGNGSIATLRWTENGEATAWNLQYGTDPTFAEGSYATMTQGFTVSGSTITANLTGLIAEQTYYARVQANCTDCGQTSPWVYFSSFKPTNAVNLTVNSGGNGNLYIPFYAHNCDLGGRSQYIIPAEDLTTMTDGEIYKFVLYGLNNLPQIENAEFRIWMKEVDFAYFDDGTFADWNDMTQVYEGRLCWNGSAWAFDFGEGNQFTYQGGNLLVAFLQTVFVPGVPYTDNWIGKSQTRYTAIYQDGSFGNFSGNVGEPQNFLPKTTFTYFVPTHPRPWNPTFSNLAATSVTVSWGTPSANVTAYQYQYKPDGGMSWTTLATTTATSITLTGLTPKQGYTFRVKAIYNNIDSEFATRTFTTGALCSMPQGISLVDVTGHTATFSWNMVQGATYQCAVTTPNESPESWIDAPAGNSYTHTGLDAETDYVFHLRRDCSASGDGFSDNNSFGFRTGLACPPPTNVQVAYNGGTTATVTWDGNAENYRVYMNGSPISDNSVTSPYTLTVDYACSDTVGVMALCGGDDGNSTIAYAEPFITELCPAENRCTINYTLTDAYGNGWGYTTGEQPHIRIIDHESNILIENLTMPFSTGPTGSSLSGSFEVCNDRTIEIIWDTAFTNIGTYECGFIFTDVNNNIICERVGCHDYYSCDAMQQGIITTYNVDCAPSCAKPKDFQANVGITTATVSWTDNGEATSWNVSYKKATDFEYGTPEEVINPTHTLNYLDPGTEYNVKIVSGCNDTLTLTGNFTTYCEAVVIDEPLIEDFDNWITDHWVYNDPDGVFPPCWRSYSEGFVRPHIINYGDHCHPHSGNCAMYFKGESNTNTYLALPPFDNAASLLVSFWMQTDHASKGNFGLGYITEGDINFNTYQELETYANSTTMVQRSTYLGRYSIPSKATHLVFRWQSDNSTYGICIDDVSMRLVDKVFNGTNNNWHNASNWTPNSMPTLNETVFIQANATITETAEAGLIALGNDVTLTLADGGTLKTDNDLVATVKKNITGYGVNNENTKKGYYLIANPVAETYYNDHIQLCPNLTSTNLLNGTYDLYNWDYANADSLEWRNYEYQNNQYDGRFNLVNGQAYLYANHDDIVATFTGTARANNIDQVMSTNFSDVQYEFNGWNLLGNPFVCDVYLNETTSAEMAFYRMNTTGDGFITATGAIHPMEGVFVQATEIGQTFKFSRNQMSGKSRGKLNVIASEANQSIILDNVLIRFGEGNTLEKFSFRQGNTKVFIPVEGKDYAVVNVGEVGELPISFKAAKYGSYTLSFDLEGLSFSYLHLIDNLTGTDVNLLDNEGQSHYTFQAKTSDYASRFRLLFATGSSTATDSDSFAFVSAAGNLTIFGTEGDATLQVVDMLGHVLLYETFSGSYERKLNVPSGLYLLRLINGTAVRIQKIVLRP